MRHLYDETIMVINKPAYQIPPLKNGDRLTREEFERRYEEMPEGTKAELINGVVHTALPASFVQHGGPHFHIVGWLNYYQAYTPGTEGADNASIRLDLENEPQPDASLIIDPAKGGTAVIDEDGFLASAPELVLEVAASSVHIDLKLKLPIYRRHKIREYIVWRVYDEQIDWFVLRGNAYRRLAAGKDGIRKSEAFPGLWLDTAALLRGDQAAVYSVVQRGLATPEHAAFVKRLNG